MLIACENENYKHCCLKYPKQPCMFKKKHEITSILLIRVRKYRYSNEKSREIR